MGKNKKNRFIGPYEVNGNGKRIKSNSIQNTSDLIRKKNKSWKYHLDIAEVNESFSSFINQSKPKNVASNFFKKTYCQYCKKQLNPGNTSNFCNKKCMNDCAKFGPKEG